MFEAELGGYAIKHKHFCLFDREQKHGLIAGIIASQQLSNPTLISDYVLEGKELYSILLGAGFVLDSNFNKLLKLLGYCLKNGAIEKRLSMEPIIDDDWIEFEKGENEFTVIS